jgi:hypothetical protein
MSNKTTVEKSDQITILRIKRKRTEEPLDALRMLHVYEF